MSKKPKIRAGFGLLLFAIAGTFRDNWSIALLFIFVAFVVILYDTSKRKRWEDKHFNN